ncbi:hypothetical protein M404DRAFT_510044 [Pisolithus tinctorius Marx 270]|uniref:Uncharacterized protein n=1 Tax=Pisolithus tinctorius Marx 270 TaxID=870435 RepID=A0A0C3NCB6_PISTI|nr:hypothetical protein M404DRAFT_510044 [Pisolithus tinctorius Marx 270]
MSQENWTQFSAPFCHFATLLTCDRVVAVTGSILYDKTVRLWWSQNSKQSKASAKSAWPPLRVKEVGMVNRLFQGGSHPGGDCDPLRGGHCPCMVREAVVIQQLSPGFHFCLQPNSPQLQGEEMERAPRNFAESCPSRKPRASIV